MGAVNEHRDEQRARPEVEGSQEDALPDGPDGEQRQPPVREEVQRAKEVGGKRDRDRRSQTGPVYQRLEQHASEDQLLAPSGQQAGGRDLPETLGLEVPGQSAVGAGVLLTQRKLQRAVQQGVPDEDEGQAEENLADKAGVWRQPPR